MIITRHGDTFFKFVLGSKTIAFNPISKNSKQKTTKFGSDLVLSSLYHPDFNGYSEVGFKDKIPFIVRGAGEYEINDIFVKGYGIKHKFEGVDEMITSYTILFDNLNIALFGPIDSWEGFSDDAFDEFSKADIFFVPIGGGDAFAPKDAAKLLKQFSPKIVIPIFYSQQSDVEEFAKAVGVEVEKMDKLTIKKTDLPDEGQTRIIDLKIV